MKTNIEVYVIKQGKMYFAEWTKEVGKAPKRSIFSFTTEINLPATPASKAELRAETKRLALEHGIQVNALYYYF